jgi:hypothetical protein
MVQENKLYDSLGIKPDASQDDIKKAYRYVLLYTLNALTHRKIESERSL